MKKRTIILGISAFYHDAAAAILVDGQLIAAASEERFTRKKGDSSFPHHAINYCLNAANADLSEIDHIAFYENHILKFSRVLRSALNNVPRGLVQFLAAIPKQLSSNIWLESQIQKELGTKKPITFFDHHLSHAASAYYPSPFENAAILTVDGVGEYATTTYAQANANNIDIKQEIHFPDSIGLLYSAFTYYTGFKINSGEYKMMGLAPYGKPRYAAIIKKHLVKIYPDGSIKLNMDYFDFERKLHTINRRFCDLFGAPPRKPESAITRHTKDVAASIQSVTEEILLKLANHVHAQTHENNLCLAGGVALNVSAIGHLREHSKFKRIWVQPASGDGGGCIGCAYLVWHQLLEKQRTANQHDSMSGALLGPDIKAKPSVLRNCGASMSKLPDTKLIQKIVDDLIDGKIIGLARGRMEFGPRALGSRSILADARVPNMKDKLNEKIKLREGFRPFAPIVLVEDAPKYFIGCKQSPYMLSTFQVNKRYQKTLPAITHVDGSARVQTIDKDRHAFVYAVLTEFKKRTGCSVLINTSYNVRGEPIVLSDLDAYRCFMETDMDACVIANYYLSKPSQDQSAYRKAFKKREAELD